MRNEPEGSNLPFTWKLTKPFTAGSLSVSVALHYGSVGWGFKSLRARQRFPSRHNLFRRRVYVRFISAPRRPYTRPGMLAAIGLDSAGRL